jgi:hypothetical protein
MIMPTTVAEVLGGVGSSCIEVASDGAVMVRDTTDRTGPVLRFDPDAWRRFADTVKRSC